MPPEYIHDSMLSAQVSLYLLLTCLKGLVEIYYSLWRECQRTGAGYWIGAVLRKRCWDRRPGVQASWRPGLAGVLVASREERLVVTGEKRKGKVPHAAVLPSAAH
jgi:hypothetical protein